MGASSPGKLADLLKISPQTVGDRDADEDVGFGAEDPAGQNPRPGVAGKLFSLGVREPSLRTDEKDDSPGRLGRDGRRAAPVIQEQSQVDAGQQRRGEKLIEPGRREQVRQRRPPALPGRPRNMSGPRAGLLVVE